MFGKSKSATCINGETLSRAGIKDKTAGAYGQGLVWICPVFSEPLPQGEEEPGPGKVHARIVFEWNGKGRINGDAMIEEGADKRIPAKRHLNH
jgi:hypothetical protein